MLPRVTFYLWVLLFSSLPVHAATPPTLLKVPLERGVDCPVYWMPHDSAQATLVLFTGGKGGLGYDAMANAPLSPNFLIRSRELFHKKGFNVAIVGRAQDRADLDFAYRKSAEHSSDIRAVLLRLQQLAPGKLWLIGTSKGTISAASAAIANPDVVAGLVLTSSVVSTGTVGNVPSLEIGKIRIPTLVLHHRKDACKVCQPERTKHILAGLTNAPRKQLILLDGGSGASGNPCDAMHHHGFIGQEAEAVDLVTSWISGAHEYK